MFLAHSRPAGKSGSIGWRRILNECSALGSEGFRWEPAAGNLTEKGWRGGVWTLAPYFNASTGSTRVVRWAGTRLGDNPHIEAFNSLVRRECLSQHWFIDLKDAQKVLDRWRLDYNTVRPHGSLQRSTPAQYGAGVPLTPSPERLRNLHP